jgi:hypothetical protein
MSAAADLYDPLPGKPQVFACPSIKPGSECAALVTDDASIAQMKHNKCGSCQHYYIKCVCGNPRFPGEDICYSGQYAQSTCVYK